jgi:hypothetical protein
VGGVAGGSAGGAGGAGGTGGAGSGSGSAGGAAPAGGAASAGGAGGPGSGPGAASAPRRVRAPQPMIRNTGDRRQRRAAVITFRLARPAVVRFRIRQEAPNCVVIGSFTVRGHAGRNRIRFAGRYRGVTLPPGTYTLTGHAFRNGRVTPLGTVTVVIVPEGATQARRRPSTCGGPDDGVDATAAAELLAAAGAQTQGGTAAGLGADGAAGEDKAGAGVASSVERTDTGGTDDADGDGEAAGAGAGDDGDDDGSSRPVLGVPNPFDEAPAWVQPLLLAALGGAILLLLLAAVPATAVRPVNAAPVVVRRRTELALAGAMILGAVAIAALIV